MSRQSDIKALRNLREQLAATGSYIKISQGELERYKKCENELTTTKFVFKPLPTNHEETCRANFVQQWTDKYSNPRPIQKIVSVICTIITVLFSVGLILDMAFVAGVVFDVAEMTDTNSLNPIFMRFLPYLIQVVFAAFCALFPWVFFSESARAVFLNFPVIAISAVATLFYLLIFHDLAGESYFPMLCYIGLILLPIFGRLVVSIIYKSKKKHPRLSAEQIAAVEQEKQKDIANAAANIEKEKKDHAEWQAWWDKHKFEIDEQMDIHMNAAKAAIKKAEELNKKVEDSDLLGPDEKHEPIIDWLIYFLEGHRADSIKEALQQFDIMKHNEKMLEIERERYNLEAQRARQEHEDRERAMEMERMHQVRMEAEAQRSASLQAQIAYNTANAADAAEKMRKEAASIAAANAEWQTRMASQASLDYLHDYYNS